MSEPVAARELIARHYIVRRPAVCVRHAQLSLTDRPRDCLECRLALEDALRRADEHLEWMQRWRDDAIDVLVRQDAALGMLQGYEPDVHAVGELAALVRRTDTETVDVLADDMTPEAAEALTEFFEKIIQTADGTAPIPADL